jgi:transcriptional regulator
MYTPAPFAERRKEELHAFIRAFPLAAIVTPTADGLIATHVPVILDTSSGEQGELRGHFARANPHARAASFRGDTIAIFTNPGAYISPSWYPSKVAHGKVVPTWNYAAVHAVGELELIDDPAFVRANVIELTTQHESVRELPWQVSDAPEPFIEQQLKAIVGFRIRIARLDGKWKMSQNRSDEDIDGVVRGLSTSNAEPNPEVAALVEARRPRRQ